MSEAKHFARGLWNVCGKRNGIGQAIDDVDEPGGEKERNRATDRHSQMQTAREHPFPADRDQRCVEADKIQPKQGAARQGASFRVRRGRGAGRLNRTDEKRISGIYLLTFPWMNGLFSIFLEFFAPSVNPLLFSISHSAWPPSYRRRGFCGRLAHVDDDHVVLADQLGLMRS